MRSRARTSAASCSCRGRYQLRSPSSFMAAGSSTARTSVASSAMATARPTPICLNSIRLSVAKIENTPTITTAALVTTPAVALMPCATASSVRSPRVDRLADPADDEHVVVHREAEQDHEQEQRQPRRDPADGLEVEQALEVAVLEDPGDHAVGGADAQQVQHDRLQRHDHAAERDEQQQEREAEHERDHDRQARRHLVVEVLRAGGHAGHVDLGAGDAVDRGRDRLVAQLHQRGVRDARRCRCRAAGSTRSRRSCSG